MSQIRYILTGFIYEGCFEPLLLGKYDLLIFVYDIQSFQPTTAVMG